MLLVAVTFLAKVSLACCTQVDAVIFLFIVLHDELCVGEVSKGQPEFRLCPAMEN